MPMTPPQLRDYEIVLFHLSDMDEVLTLEKEIFPEDAFTRRVFNAMYKHAQDTFFVVRTNADKRLIGYITAYLLNKTESYIASIGIHPDYRQLGIGRQLIDILREKFTEKGAAMLTLHVRMGNENAIAFYHKLGFKVESKIRRYYPDGEAAFSMVLPLFPTENHEDSNN